MKWTLRQAAPEPAELKSLNLSPITLQLLLQRNFFSTKDISKFLNTRFEDLHSPLGLSGMKEAIQRISQAKKGNEKVIIFGDYDADGITSTILLKESLEHIGIDPATYIPDRNKEGYGLNKTALDSIKEEHNPQLLITVDCGISNWEEVQYAHKLGMDTIIIDHHSIPKKIPQKCILINPKLPHQKYPFRDLAGVGVVFKFSCALWEELLPEKVPQLKWFLDIVAIGTIADCVPLVDENRIFAKFGLIVLQKTKRIGIQEIIKTARINIDEKNPPNAESIAYQIGPRFNASGRMDHADLTLNLLAEKNPAKARLAALEVESKNSERQKVTQQVYSEVKRTLEKNKDYRLIIRKGEHWPLGILGVVAGKIADEYQCPVFILREGSGLLEGSGRSIDVFDLISAVSQIDSLIEKYGGHSQAMGLKIKPQKLAEFEKKLLGIIDSSYDKKTWGKNILIDISVKAEDIDWDILSEIKKFEPFGEGNREPVFLSDDLMIEEMKLVGNGQKHIKFIFKTKKGVSKMFEGIFFKHGDRFQEFKKKDGVSVAYNMRTNEWNGNHKIELHVIDIKKNDHYQ
jgi:single-stranded-DNA-specific exonuclease